MTPDERRNGGPGNVPTRHPKPYFLSATEVAHALRVSRMTAYRLINSGQLGAVRVGRAYRVPERELSRFVAVHRVSLNPDFRWHGKAS